MKDTGRAKRIENKTDKEYFDKNKESLLLYQKLYADLNKDKLKDRKKLIMKKQRIHKNKSLKNIGN